MHVCLLTGDQVTSGGDVKMEASVGDHPQQQQQPPEVTVVDVQGANVLISNPHIDDSSIVRVGGVNTSQSNNNPGKYALQLS